MPLFEKSLITNGQAMHVKQSDAYITEKLLGETRHGYSAWVIAVAIYFSADQSHAPNAQDYEQEGVILEQL